MHRSRRHRIGGAQTAAPLGSQQRRLIYREMVKAELDGGTLRRRKHRELLRYAGKMGVPGGEAEQIVADVLRDHGAAPPGGGDSLQAALGAAQQRLGKMSLLLMVLITVVLLKLVIFNWTS